MNTTKTFRLFDYIVSWIFEFDPFLGPMEEQGSGL